MEDGSVLLGTFLQGAFFGDFRTDRWGAWSLFVIYHRDSQRDRERAESVVCLCDEVRIEFRKDAHDEIGTLDKLRGLLGDGISFHGQSSGVSSAAPPGTSN